MHIAPRVPREGGHRGGLPQKGTLAGGTPRIGCRGEREARARLRVRAARVGALACCGARGRECTRRGLRSARGLAGAGQRRRGPLRQLLRMRALKKGPLSNTNRGGQGKTAAGQSEGPARRERSGEARRAEGCGAERPRGLHGGARGPEYGAARARASALWSVACQTGRGQHEG
ncbi:MAG: hypothetical protein J3K34DRAFT_413875 [Monoraphidium minutum]|nr:MAG: hypothetical protein J3K34DRAFT_413875 [Monoraphidium minutum]